MSTLLRGQTTRYTICIISIAIAASSFAELLEHTYSASRCSDSIRDWPSGSKIVARGEKTCVLFAHPKCPCLVQTLDELNRLVAASPISRVMVVFVNPPDASPDWHLGANWRISEQFGFDRIIDHGAREAGLFKATCSGQLMVFDQSGSCRFNGGITSGRGHEGPSAGAIAVNQLLHNQSVQKSSTPVYGCPLLSSAE